MKLLVSNDDGINSPGLHALHEAALAFGEPVVVAPAGAQSGMSHAVTFDRPVRLEERDAGRYALHGTPVDCARIGLHRVAPDAKWVLSGINHGGNLGTDIYYSGTVGVIREAVLHGWPGIAFSHYHREGMIFDWPRAQRWAARVLTDLLARPVELGTFYNVNFPHLTATEPEPGIVECPLDPSPLPLSYREEENGHHHYDGRYSSRKRLAKYDVDVCFSGSISLTKVKLF
jgi:5'-nucleotidase